MSIDHGTRVTWNIFRKIQPYINKIYPFLVVVVKIAITLLYLIHRDLQLN